MNLRNLLSHPRNRFRLILYSYHFVNDAVVFLLPTIMGRLYQTFNLNFFEINWIFALNTLATLLSQLVCGWAVDKERGILFLYVGPTFLTISTMLLVLSTDFTTLLFLNTLSGIALGFQHSTTYTLTVKLFPGDVQEKYMGIQASTGDAGKLVAIATTSLLLLFGYPWQLSFWIWGGAAMGTTILIVLLLRSFDYQEVLEDARKEYSPVETHITSTKPTKQKIPIRNVVLVICMFILFNAAFDLNVKNFTAYLKAARPLEVAPYAEILFTLLMGIGVIGALLSGFVAKRLGTKRALLLEYIGLGTILFLFLVAGDSLFLTSLTIPFIAFFQFLTYPVILSASNRYMPEHRRGLGFGLIMGIGWLGGFISAPITGYYADIYGPDLIFIVSIVFIVISAVVTSLIRFPDQNPSNSI